MNIRVLSVAAALALGFGLQQSSLSEPSRSGDVALVDYKIRVAATIRDSEKKQESRNPSQYGDQDVPIQFQSNSKSRYRLPFPVGQRKFEGYYSVEVFDKATPRLPDMTTDPEATPWKAMERTERKQHFK